PNCCSSGIWILRIPDQVWPQSSDPAGQVVGGDGIRSLGGVQRLLQPLLERQQGLGVGPQLVDVPLQLRLPVVDLLQPLSQETCSVGLVLQSVRLGVLVQNLGLSLDAPGRLAVRTGLLEDAVVVVEPLGRAVFSGAVPGGEVAWGSVSSPRTLWHACRPGESNQRSSNNKKLALPLSHSRPQVL
uniref:Uncharacterized protein n=1 Tax=Sparus aurata TaxID=8175 RepID=A0A671TGA7_SPAAU